MIEEHQGDVSSVRAMVLKQFWSKIEKNGPPGHQIEIVIFGSLRVPYVSST